MIRKTPDASKLIETGVASGGTPRWFMVLPSRARLGLAMLRREREIQFWNHFSSSTLVKTQEKNNKKKRALSSVHQEKIQTLTNPTVSTDKRLWLQSPTGDHRCVHGQTSAPKNA